MEYLGDFSGDEVSVDVVSLSVRPPRYRCNDRDKIALAEHMQNIDINSGDFSYLPDILCRILRHLQLTRS